MSPFAMTGKAVLVLMALASGTVAPAALAQDQERQILVSTLEMSHFPVDTLRLSGSAQGRRVDLEATLKRGSGTTTLVVRVSSGKRQIGQVSVSDPAYGDIYLPEARYAFRLRGGKIAVKVQLPFGEGNDCFSNDDGQSVLGIDISENAPTKANVTTYEACKPKVRPLTLKR